MLWQLSDGFEDLAHLSFAAAAQKIFDQEVDILLDMQLHTLGNRLAITARHPGAIQVCSLLFVFFCGVAICIGHCYVIAAARLTTWSILELAVQVSWTIL